MLNAKPISTEEFKRIEMILMDIATRALTLKDLARQTLSHCGRGPAASIVAAMEPMAAQIGYLTEVVLERVGSESGFSEGPAYWFLAESCRAQEKPQKIIHE